MPARFLRGDVRREAVETSRRRKDRRQERRRAQKQRERELLEPAEPNAALGDILESDFRSEFERLQGSQSDLEQKFLDRVDAPIDFEAFRGELSALAESVTGELFGAGGQVERATQGAAGRTVETGFGTSSGGFDRARQNIFGEARDVVGNRISQGAIQLSGQAVQNRATTLGNLGGFVSEQGGRLDSLRESLFGGQASIEQLRLAEEQLKDNRRLLNEGLQRGGGGGVGGFFKDLAGGAAGLFTGGIATNLADKLFEN